MASFQLRTHLLFLVASSQMAGRLNYFVSSSEERNVVNEKYSYLDGLCYQLIKTTHILQDLTNIFFIYLFTQLKQR